MWNKMNEPQFYISRFKCDLTGVATHTASRTSRGEEHDDIAQELDVSLERIALLGRKLLLRRIELQPKTNKSGQ